VSGPHLLWTSLWTSDAQGRQAVDLQGKISSDQNQGGRRLAHPRLQALKQIAIISGQAIQLRFG
jgi:hypothetical protein